MVVRQTWPGRWVQTLIFVHTEELKLNLISTLFSVLSSQLTSRCGPLLRPRQPTCHPWTPPSTQLPTPPRTLQTASPLVSSTPLRPAWLQLWVIQALSLIIHHMLSSGQVLHLIPAWAQLWSFLWQLHAVRHILFLPQRCVESNQIMIYLLCSNRKLWLSERKSLILSKALYFKDTDELNVV